MDEAAHNPNTDRIIECIEERKRLNAELDELRVEALRIAIDADILDEFSDLKPWYSSARSQGLVHGSSWSEPKSPGQLDSARQDINALLSQIQHTESLVSKLTDEIRRG